MGYSYAVNSEGTVLDTHTITRPISIASFQFRQKELASIKEDVAEVFQAHDIIVNPNEFDHMIQPFYLEDRLIFFTKEVLEASDSRVRQSSLVRENPDYHFKDANLDEQLRSIFSVNENNRTVWYLLGVESIAMERNLNDCKYIRIQAEDPLPYHTFLKSIPNMVMTGDEAKTFVESNVMTTKYTAVSPLRRPYSDAISLIQTSVLRDKPCPKAVLDRAVDAAQEVLRRKYHIREKDIYSNQKMICLHQIIDCKRDEKKEYGIYERFKRFLKKELPGTNGICYKDNAFYFRIPNRERGVVFVINPEKEHFNAGGTVIKGFDNLMKSVKDDSIFTETEWFDAIKPYVIEKERSKQERSLV